LQFNEVDECDTFEKKLELCIAEWKVLQKVEKKKEDTKN